MAMLNYLYANVEKYKKILADELVSANKGESRFQQLSIMAEPERARIVSHAYTGGPNRRIDLIYPPDPANNNEREEIILKVQGYATKVELPPFTNSATLPRNIRGLRQHISINGLGDPNFDKCATAMMAIHRVIDSQLSRGSLQPWTPTAEQGYICLEFSNRYYSSTEEADGRAACNFSSNIDPFGVLANAHVKGTHTDDNEVLYYERRPGKKEGEHQYIDIPPTGIREGCLVELQVGFAAVPINKGRYIMINKLRSICVIGRQLEHDVNLEAVELFKNAHTTGNVTLKRTVGYRMSIATNNEDEEETHTFMKRLKLGNEGDSNMSEDDDRN